MFPLLSYLAFINPGKYCFSVTPKFSLVQSEILSYLLVKPLVFKPSCALIIPPFLRALRTPPNLCLKGSLYLS